jgi:hypothetical protein
MFMSSSLDPRIESVMPILRKLSKNITETSDMAETIALEEWASEIIGEAPELSKAKPSKQDVAKKMHGILSKSVNKSNMARVKTQQAVGSRVADIGAGGKEYNVKTDAAWDAKEKGLSEDSFDNPVSNAITRRILMQRSDLLAKYGPEKVTAAIDDVADFVGDTDEIGSSDVSGWVKQVEQSLAGMSESETNEGVLDAVRNKMQSGSMLDRVRSGAYKKPAAPVAPTQAAPTAPAAAPPPGYDTETGKPLPPEARFDPNTGKPLPGLSPAAPVATRPPLPSAQAAAAPRPPATATPTAPQPSTSPTELPPDWKFGMAVPRSVWKAGDDPNKNPNNPIIVTMAKTRDALIKQGRGNPDEIQHSITRANRGQEFNTYGMTGYVDEGQDLSEGQEDLDAIKRLLGEGWKGEFAGGTAGGIAGNMAGNAIAPGIGGIVGGAIGGTAGGMAGRALGDTVDEEQLNEIAPLLAVGARAIIIPLLSKIGPALGRMASTAGKAGSQVAGKAATGIGRGTADVAKSAAQSAAQNAGTIGVGVGAYQAITDVANSLVGGVGEVYHDAKSAAEAIAQAVGNSVDKSTIAELAMAAAKYAIPIGILLAVLYGGKKLIDQVMSEGADDSEMGALGQMVGKITPNPSDFVAGFKKTFEGQEDLDTIKRLLGK